MGYCLLYEAMLSLVYVFPDLTFLYLTDLYLTFLYLTVLYLTILYLTVLYLTILYLTVLYLTVLFFQIDCIVSEWMGYCLLYEAMFDSIIFARDK